MVLGIPLSNLTNFELLSPGAATLAEASRIGYTPGLQIVPVFVRFGYTIVTDILWSMLWTKSSVLPELGYIWIYISMPPF